MLDHLSQSSLSAADANIVLASMRGDSELRASFMAEMPEAADGGGPACRTHPASIFESGALRIRFPRAGGHREAVFVNTGGGITGGDRVSIELDLGPRAALVATSQAAEKLYRSDGRPAQIAITARLGESACLDWLPQETILFDRASVVRHLNVSMAASARLTILESLVLGRIAHGEALRDVRWFDRWRVRRGDRLVLAEDVRLTGDITAKMERPAIGGGARALATLVHVAPDAEAVLDRVRGSVADPACLCGASAWNGMLVARFAAADPQALRGDVIRATMAITGRTMPRAWSI